MGDMALSEVLSDFSRSAPPLVPVGHGAEWPAMLASPRFPDLLDPAVRGLPINALAIAFALVSRSAGSNPLVQSV